ncbi:MAG TPA: choice-of-anchor D domain-containing protein [Terriglobia bacterium]|nr:choice-of-anchor D domain-containing protein [Terriglobia bacterium]
MSRALQFPARILTLLALVAGSVATASAQVTVSPPTLSFGNVGLGLEGHLGMSITNSGPMQPITVTSFTFSSPVFGLRSGAFPQTMGPGLTTNWSIGAKPTAAQTYNETLTINFASGPPVVVPISVTGVQNTGVPSMSTSNINFGSVALGSTVTQNVTVTNTGAQQFDVTAVDYSAPFAVTGFSGTKVLLSPGKSLNLTVSYSPFNLGYGTGFVTISYDYLPSTGVALSGTGVSPTGLAITNFPILPAATQGAAYQATLLATGGQSPYTWQLVSGSVPGLSLDPSSGIISGTVSSSAGIQNYTLSFQVQDSSANVAMATLTLPVDPPTGANCNMINIDVPGTTTPTVPINDLGTGTYLGYEGGLYPNGSNVDPSDHQSAGVSIGQGIMPLDSDGTPDPVNGLMGLISFGPSTTYDAFTQFINQAHADPQVNPKLVFVNGAIPNETAGNLVGANSAYWPAILNYIVPFAGISANQVVAAWVDIIDSLSSTFPTDSQTLQGELETLAQQLHTNFPNLKVAYFGSLNYSGYSNGVDAVNPEPQGYETGWADKWAIQDQIDGLPSLNFDSSQGPVMAPWMAWGPYYWSNGLIARPDGTYWSCQDLNSDGLHPNYPNGQNKINEVLLNFLKTDPSATPWFLPPPATTVTIAPTSLTFAGQTVGTTSPAQTVTVTNTGTSVLTVQNVNLVGTDPGDYAQTNNCLSGVGPGATCTISVTFTPVVGGGETRTASVSIADNAAGSPQTVSLTGTGTGGSPTVTLSPKSLSYSRQLVGTSSAAQAVTLTNSGNAPLNITSVSVTGTNPGDFTETNGCGADVEPGTNCTINVTFTPVHSGTRKATVSITDNATGSPQTVSLTGVGTQVELVPLSLSFTNQAIGTTSPAQTVTLTNTSPNAALTINSITITGTNSGDFAQTNTCGTGVAIGASCTISVTFTPTAGGTRTASVSISDSGGGSPQTVSLTGAGGLPSVSLSPTSLTFASQNIGTTSPAQVVTLTNTGNGTLSLTSITITGTNPGDFAETNTCGTAVAAGANCSISVTFSPTTTGTRTATLSVTDNAAGSPQTVSLTGTGASTATVTLKPTTLTFSKQLVGTSSTGQTITLSVTGAGNGGLNITSISITGTAAGDFSQTNTCGASVAFGSSCSITVTFTPIVNGTRKATLSISDDAPGSPQTAALSGVGTSVELTPSSLTFGSQTVGTTSPAQVVTVTNLSAMATLSITDISFTGTNPGDFAQTNTCSDTVVRPGKTCTISVTFTPAATGTRTASLSITDNGGGSPQTASITGTGTTGGTPTVTLTPTSLQFGKQLKGTASAAQPVTLTNTGTAVLNLTSIAIAGTNPGDFGETNNCGTTVAAGASCTINVTFSPVMNGTRTATVSVTDNASGSPQTVTLTGTGTSVELVPSSLTFASQTVGTTSAPQSVTVTNVGANTTISITSIAVTGANSGDFAQTNTCGSSIKPGASCSISVTFTPTATGARSASVTLTDNGGGGTQTVSLTGTGM